MIEFKNTIIVERPLKEVFAFISDFGNMSKWNCSVMDVNKLTNGLVGIGTTYHQTRKTDQQQFRVVEFEPDQAIAIETLSPEKKRNIRFQFKPIDIGTQMIDEWQLEIDTPQPFRMIAAKKIKSADSENLEKLKILLETGHVILQDGREIRYRLHDSFSIS